MSQKQSFRCPEGCCICRTKSSSSRFVSSGDYASFFGQVFGAKARTRTGQICNACVLCVKRGQKNGCTGKVQYANVLDSRQGTGPKHQKQITKRNQRREQREAAAAAAEKVEPQVDTEEAPTEPPSEFRTPYPRRRAFYKKRVILPPVKLPNAEEIGELFQDVMRERYLSENPLDSSEVHHALLSGKRRRLYAGSETTSICSTEPAESFVSDSQQTS